jgi:hypothetical protein
VISTSQGAVYQTVGEPIGGANAIIGLLVWAAFWSFPLNAHASQAAHQRASPDYRSAILATWLRDSKLDQYLELMRVRRIPDPLNDEGAPVLALELRAKPVGDDQAYDLAYLDAFDRRFKRDHRESLWEKLFYKFVHVYEVPQDSAVVSILIYHAELLVFSDSAGNVRTQLSTTRMVEGETVIPDDTVKSVSRIVGPGRQTVAPKKRVDGEKIVAFLHQRFSQKRTKVLASRDNYVRATVRGLRSEVISAPRVWERLELSIRLIRSEGATTIIVFADGQYASGTGTRPPPDEAFTDMEPRFTRSLTEYVGALLVDLRSFLTG